MLTSKLLFYCTVALCSQEYAHVGQAGNIHIEEFIAAGMTFLIFGILFYFAVTVKTD